MLQESLDLRAEADALHAFLATLAEADWGRPTGFLGWTPWDVVAHLHLYDDVSRASLAGKDAFRARRDVLLKAGGEGKTNAEIILLMRASTADELPGWVRM